MRGFENRYETSVERGVEEAAEVVAPAREGKGDAEVVEKLIGRGREEIRCGLYRCSRNWSRASSLWILQCLE